MHAKCVRIKHSVKHNSKLCAILQLTNDMVLMHVCAQQEHCARIWCLLTHYTHCLICTVHCQIDLSCSNAGMLAHLFLKAFEGAIWLALVGLLVGLARSPP